MESFFCSFCGKKEEDVDIFITGKTGCICGACARQVASIAQRGNAYKKAQAERESSRIDWATLKPKDLHEHLNAYVIGQEEAKKTLSVAVYNHYKRLDQEERELKEHDETVPAEASGDAEAHQDRGNASAQRDAEPKREEPVVIEKSNIILIGDTGVGKTYIIQTIAKKVKVPFAISDATSLTQTGYVGEDVESVLVRLVQAADYNIPAAEKGIVYIDEFDKLARKDENLSTTRDVGGEGVQQAMLKIIEGTSVNIPPEGGRKHPDQKMISLNTKNILFICGGAFEGIRSIINRRIKSSDIGFHVKDGKPVEAKEGIDQILSQVSAQDLKAFGLIPELVGRLPILTYLNPLTPDMLKKILVDPKNALVKQYQKLFSMEGVQLSFSEDALDYIVREALKRKLGARSLRNILELALLDAMYELPSQKHVKKLHVDLGYVREKLGGLAIAA